MRAASLFYCGDRVKEARYDLVKLMYQCNHWTHARV